MSVPVRTRSPQPLSSVSEDEHTKTTNMSVLRLFVLPAIPSKGKNKRANATVFFLWAKAVVLGVAIVIVKRPEEVPGTMLPGLNDAVARSGSPEADSVTGDDRLP